MKRFFALALAVLLLVSILPQASVLAGVDEVETADVGPGVRVRVPATLDIDMSAAQYGERFENGCFITYRYDENDRLKWGLISKEGAVILPIEYEQINVLENDLIYVIKDNKCGYINYLGETVISMNYNVGDLKLANQGYIQFNKNGKNGFFDLYGNIVYETTMWIGMFGNGLFPFYENGYYGYMNIEQKIVIPCKYIMAAEFINEFAIAKEEDFYGCINTKGERMIDFSTYGENLTAKMLENNENNKYIQLMHSSDNGEIASALIDYKGDLILPFDNYHSITTLGDSFLSSVIKEDGISYFSIYNSNGDFLDCYPDFDDRTVGVAFVCRSDCGHDHSREYEPILIVETYRGTPSLGKTNIEFIQFDGKRLLEDNTYYFCGPYQCGIIIAKRFDNPQLSYDFINRNGEIVATFNDGLNPHVEVSNSTVVFDIEGNNGRKYGLMDKVGAVILPATYDYISKVYETSPSSSKTANGAS